MNKQNVQIPQEVDRKIAANEPQDGPPHFPSLTCLRRRRTSADDSELPGEVRTRAKIAQQTGCAKPVPKKQERESKHLSHQRRNTAGSQPISNFAAHAIIVTSSAR